MCMLRESANTGQIHIHLLARRTKLQHTLRDAQGWPHGRAGKPPKGHRVTACSKAEAPLWLCELEDDMSLNTLLGKMYLLPPTQPVSSQPEIPKPTHWSKLEANLQEDPAKIPAN